MRGFIAENGVEETCLEWFADIGWNVLYGPDIAADTPAAERTSYRDVLLDDRLRDKIATLNPHLQQAAIDDVVAIVRRPESADLFAENWRLHQLMTDGVHVEYRNADGEVRHDMARLIDWDHVGANDFVVVNQFTVEGDAKTRRPDVVCFVNGLPVAILELKAPGQQGVTLRGAWQQLGTYAQQIPQLLAHTVLSVIATGTQARIGALGGHFEHFAPWKTVDGTSEAPVSMAPLEVLIHGAFEPARLLDLIRNFVVFSDERSGVVKRVAKYHQFHAVNKAVESTVEAISRGDGRAGVVWHTQGSGKSLEMLFYVGKILRDSRMENPTAVMLTDRNDLDDQLFDEVFTPARNLPESPVQAGSREDLRSILSSKASGGIVFTTMQKFGLTGAERDANRSFPLLSERRNIVVIADEAHRTQYDLIDGFARNLRDALPAAAFIGFTGTPIETGDKNTRAVFGEYIDVYDLTQAVEDEATVKVFYEARLAKVELPADVAEQLDDEFAEATNLAEEDTRERMKGRWGRVEAVVGARPRIEKIAADLVDHWEARRDQTVGKAMVVCMSRRICVELYDQIVALRPDWHSDDDAGGRIKVVVTGSAADGPEMARHIRGKEALRALKERAKNPSDPLELVIVRDMWLTGFDSPSMHTMYVDKPMRGAGLMQAIARVNRTFRDKPGGLVVDYIGIAESLRAALVDYTDRDRRGKDVGAPVGEALALLAETHEILDDLMRGCAWRVALESGSAKARLEAIMVGLGFLVGDGSTDLGDRFLFQVRRAGQAFSLVPALAEAQEFRDDLAFWQALAVELRRLRSDGRGEAGDDVELETALRQVVSDAVTVPGVIDIYAAAGIDKPDISIIDDDFAKRMSTSPNLNLQIELLKRLLNAELRRVSLRSVVSERKFSEMLQKSVRAYTNRSLDAAEVMAELVDLAQHMKADRERGAALGLNESELAFYDAVCQNDSAVLELEDETLKKIAVDLVGIVNRNSTIDWDKKESVRALMRSQIRRLLVKHKYPPDRQEMAISLVLQQAELLARVQAA